MAVAIITIPQHQYYPEVYNDTWSSL